MKILLSYSKFHFDPNIPLADQKYKNSSASILARTLYSVLTELGDVEYVNFDEYDRVCGKSYDVFIGISNNFDRFVERINAPTKILFGVNQYYKSRNQILSDIRLPNKYNVQNKFLRYVIRKLGLRRYCNIDWRQELAPALNLDNIDHIIVCGNDIVKKSYTDNGFDADKIYTFNYDLLRGPAKSEIAQNTRPRFIYIATTLCLRKGYDLIYEFADVLKQCSDDFELSIVGDAASTPYYKHKNRRLLKKYPNNIKYYGFLFDDELSRIIKQHDFLLFPSLEECQAGTVLDAMHCGVIPIITHESGVDFSPLGYLSPKLHSEQNAQILRSALQTTVNQRMALSAETVDYYNNNHLDFATRLKQIVKQVIDKSNK